MSRPLKRFFPGWFRFRFGFVPVLAVLLCCTGICPHAGNVPSTAVFKEIERVGLKLDDLAFANISAIAPLPGGFILLLNESAYGRAQTLVKISRSGDFITKYDKRGNGPGELRFIENLVVRGESILVPEASAPYIHEFSHRLEFLRDHRVKRGGKGFLLGKYIGIWSLNFSKENNGDKIFILALYDRDTFEFKKYAYEIPEVPAFVHLWGNPCRVDNGTFAGVYPVSYHVSLFDADMEWKGTIKKEITGHFREYVPWGKDPGVIAPGGIKWMHSWVKMHSVFYVDGKFILTYMQDKKYFYDVISLDGTPLVSGVEGRKNGSFVFTRGAYIWRLESNGDRTKRTLVKEEIQIH